MKTSKYIFTVSLLLALSLLPAAAQTNHPQGEEENPFAFKGVGVSVDTYGFINTLFDDYVSSEVALYANIGNRFFPIVEVGYGSIDTTDDLTLIGYKSSAPYYRAGLNYNFLYKKKGRLSNYKLFALARYGATSVEYDVKSPPLTDPVWGGSADFEQNNVKASCSWFEVGVGVQVKVWRNFNMGWSLRYKTLLKDGDGTSSKVWYIPGYGENKSSCFGGTLNLIIDIPFGKKQ